MPNANNSGDWFTTSEIENIIAGQTAAMKRRKARSRSEEPVSNEPLVAKQNFLFGCDPEGFLFEKGKDTAVPAAGIIPGNKWEPHKVEYGAVQVDGMAAEFNIDPVDNYADWERNISSVIAQLTAMLPEHLEIRWVPSVVFPEDVFDKAPDEAKELGCMPDFDAHTGGVNPPPRFDNNPYMRCAGGHLHIGWTKGEDVSSGQQHIMNCQDLGKQLDWFLGGWSAYVDSDRVRRNLYGKMGAIRYKDYGLEYRVLSNFWVATPELRRQVWDRMISAVDNIAGYYMPDRASKGFTKLLRSAINHGEFHHDLEYAAEYPILTLDSRRARI